MQAAEKGHGPAIIIIIVVVVVVVVVVVGNAVGVVLLVAVCFISIPMPPRRHITPRRTQPAGQQIIDVILFFTDGCGLCPHSRLVLFDPESFGDHPLCGQGT